MSAIHPLLMQEVIEGKIAVVLDPKSHVVQGTAEHRACLERPERTPMDIDRIREIRALVSLEAPDSTVLVPVGDLRELLDAAERAGGAS